jgi:membrane protein DedA with SNARE-associated domain
LRHFLREYLDTHGFLVVFVWTFNEGEVGLTTAGFLAFERYLNIIGAMLAALAGPFCDDRFDIFAGRLKGPVLLKLFTQIARKYLKALRLKERYRTFTAFVFRLTYGFRIILPKIPGVTNLACAALPLAQPAEFPFQDNSLFFSRIPVRQERFCFREGCGKIQA